jgi:hypothetical protein
MKTLKFLQYHSFRLILILLFVPLSLAVFNACEKEITIDIPRPDPKIVIEGWIENGFPARVIVTKSAPYFDPIDSATLANSLVTNATVTVSDGILSENLVIGINPEYFPYIMYMGSSIIGVPGRTYFLTVQVDGKTYTSETTLLQPLPLDSVWFALEPGKDSLGYVWGIGSDNVATEDFYRMFTKRIGKDAGYVPMLGSTWEDKYFNGQKFTFSIYRGEASFLMETPTSEEGQFGLFIIGDTVVVKLACITDPVYQFWSSAEAEAFSGGNPFSSPALIPTNITGGALGVWSGYASSFDTIVTSY